MNCFGDKRPLSFTEQNGSGPLTIYFDGQTVVRIVQGIASSSNTYAVERALGGRHFRQNSQSRLDTYRASQESTQLSEPEGVALSRWDVPRTFGGGDQSSTGAASRHAGSTLISGVASGNVKSSGLVESHATHRCQLLDGATGRYDHAKRIQAAHGCPDSDWCSKAQGARTGDEEYGHRVEQALHQP